VSSYQRGCSQLYHQIGGICFNGRILFIVGGSNNDEAKWETSIEGVLQFRFDESEVFSKDSGPIQVER
jgi:hypothetical protein